MASSIIAAPTVLGGALVRYRTGWFFSGQTVTDPRFEDARLAHLAPPLCLAWEADGDRRHWIEIDAEWRVPELDFMVAETLDAMIGDGMAEEVPSSVILPLDEPGRVRTILTRPRRYRIPLALFRLFFSDLVGAQMPQHVLGSVVRHARNCGGAK